MPWAHCLIGYNRMTYMNSETQVPAHLGFILDDLDKRKARQALKSWEQKFGSNKTTRLDEIFEGFANVAGKSRKANSHLLEFAEPQLMKTFREKALPPHIQKAIDENLSSNQIKESIKNWKADYNRA